MSLRSRFTLALLVISAAGIILASGIILYSSTRELLSVNRETLRVSCESVIEAHRSFLEEKDRVMERIAASPILMELLDSTGIARRIALKAAEAEMSAILASTEGIVGLAIHDSAGAVLALPRDVLWDEAEGEGEAGLLRLPDGRWCAKLEREAPRGRVLALVDLGGLGRNGMIPLLAEGGVAAFVALSSSGKVVWTDAGNPVPELPKIAPEGLDRTGFLEYERGGVPRIACRIDRKGYAYVAEVSRVELLAGLDRFTRLAALGALVLLAAGAFTSLLISRRLTSSIEALANAARRISRKDYRVELDIHTGDEMEELYIAFKDMGGEIERFTSDLEAIVAARTEELKERMEEIERLMIVDSLTGIANRRKGSEMLEAETARSTRYGNRLCLILFDIDHFKAVNDRYGHGTGDRVLAGVAGAAAGTLRPVDLAVRWGGEEFIVILPETDLEGGVAAAEKIRRSVGELRFQDGLAVTISAGVAFYAAHESVEGFVERADAAMYLAKSGGRDRVVRANAREES